VGAGRWGWGRGRGL